MVHGAIVAVERKNKEAWLGSGRVGSCPGRFRSSRVNVVLYPTGP